MPTLRLAKRINASVRSRCSISPCNVATENPSDCSALATSRHPWRVAQNTSALSGISWRRILESVRSLSRALVYTSRSSTMPGARVVSTITLSGFFCTLRLKVRISSGKVAENNSVCRLRGSGLTISITSSENPISKSRSASSNTSVRIAETCNNSLRMCLAIRPGVPTTMCAPARMETSWGRPGMPPQSVTSLMFGMFRASRRISAATCSASSRTGQITSA